MNYQDSYVQKKWYENRYGKYPQLLKKALETERELERLEAAEKQSLDIRNRLTNVGSLKAYVSY